MLQGEPGLADGGGIRPMAENRSVLAIEGALLGQLADMGQQLITTERRLIPGSIGSSFVDRLSDSGFVLAQLLQSLLEPGVSVRLRHRWIASTDNAKRPALPG